MELGARLRQVRKWRQLTLTDVHDRTELSVSFLSDIERGRTKPSLDTLEKLARCYETSVQKILAEVDFDTSASDSDIPTDIQYPPGFKEFLEETNVDGDLQELLLQVEQRARKQPTTAEEWKEYYYSLKRILGR